MRLQQMTRKLKKARRNESPSLKKHMASFYIFYRYDTRW